MGVAAAQPPVSSASDPGVVYLFPPTLPSPARAGRLFRSCVYYTAAAFHTCTRSWGGASHFSVAVWSALLSRLRAVDREQHGASRGGRRGAYPGELADEAMTKDSDANFGN